MKNTERSSRSFDELVNKVQTHNIGQLVKETDETPVVKASLEDIASAVNEILDILKTSHIVSKQQEEVTILIGEHRFTGKMNAGT